MFGQLWDYHREVIKGQKYTLLSQWANLSQEGRRSLKELFAVNERLNKAYLLKDLRPEPARAGAHRASEVSLGMAAGRSQSGNGLLLAWRRRSRPGRRADCNSG
jgi:hypothetical protein